MRDRDYRRYPICFVRIPEFDEQRLYEGQAKQGLHHGWGRRIFEDGSCFIGEFQDGAMHGEGAFYDPNGNEFNKGSYEKNEYQGDKY